MPSFIVCSVANLKKGIVTLFAENNYEGYNSIFWDGNLDLRAPPFLLQSYTYNWTNDVSKGSEWSEPSCLKDPFSTRQSLRERPYVKSWSTYFKSKAMSWADLPMGWNPDTKSCFPPSFGILFFNFIILPEVNKLKIMRN